MASQINLFCYNIAMDDHNQSDVVRQKLQLAITTLILGLILMVLKYYGYILTSSRAIFSDALESVVNVVSGIVLILVIYHASKPANKEHPYGHGKLESLASVFEGGAVLFAGVMIVIESIESLIEGVEIRDLDWGLVIIIIAGLANGMMGWLLKSRGERTHSPAMKASGIHLISDCWTSLGILFGLILVKWTGILWLDPLIAICVGLQLSYHGGQVLFSSGEELMDSRDMSLISDIAMSFQKNLFPGMIRIHNTRIMRSGNHHHIDMHMVVPEFWQVDKAHEELDRFERAVIRDYSFQGEMHVHLDPCRKKYCQVCELEDCPIREEQFIQKIPLTYDELVSDKEPDIEEILKGSQL